MRKIYLLLMIVFAQLMVGFTTHAQTKMLFDYASDWRYLDNGSNQGTAWRDAAFNDASWTQAAGIFGYGDSWITVLMNACGTVTANPPCSNKYITTYFRKTINIDDVSQYSGVTFNLWRDDGMVVYVNGVEVWRDNLPTGTIAYNTSAPSAIGNPNENSPITTTIPISAFTNGNNVIAVEMHQNGGSSSDLTFNMQALAVIKTDLMNYGSAWKYNTGSDQGTAWRASGFNDASWATGTGRFGYGENYINTCVAAGASCPTYSAAGPCNSVGSCTKYPTIYFRSTLNIPSPALFDFINFSVYMDDGVVMYVNGTEVWRNNMPAGTILYSTVTPNQIAENTAVNVSIPISAFNSGNNAIAFELHQTGTGTSTSSDADFDAKAVGVPHVVPALVRGPYLQVGNESAFTVRWRTNVACKSKVEVGTDATAYPIVVSDAALVTEHEVRVTGLTADTKYFYRFGSDLDVLQGDTTNFYVTAPAPGTSRRVTIAAYGDCGQNSNGNQSGALSAYRNYLNTIGLKAADLMLLVGDNAYNSGTDGEYQSGFFGAYQGNILKNHMLFPAPGNHDYENGSSARQNDHNIPYYNIFSMPTAGECGGVPSGKEEYYSYNWGDVHVLSLDSYGRENAGTTRLYDTLGAQVQWIKADLAANTKKWVIAYWHHPPYTKGSHNSDNEGELVNIRQNFIRILERYGVDLIICGHSHDYERSYLLKNHFGNEASFDLATHAVDNSSAKYDGSANSCPYTTESGQVNHGTVYVVAGSSGASGGTQGGYPHDAFPFSLNDGGMFFLDINNNRLDAKFIRKDNTIYDQFTIMKDVNVTDTVKILNGSSVEIAASWEGDYTWAPSVTTRSVTVTPGQDTLIEVKDNETATCLTDKIFVDLLCTTPDITSVPANITREGCDNVVSYAVADTGRPAPTYTYAFAGATTATGNGTGSGSTFSIGVTTVTLTATNECGSTSRDFTITIKPLPVAYNMTGGGGYCPAGAGLGLGLDNSQSGVTYQLYDGAAAVGSAVAGTGGVIAFGTFTAAATYSVLATDDVTGCTNGMANDKTISIYPRPAAQVVNGGGNYCAGAAGVPVGLDNSQSGVGYQLYDGATAIGSPIYGADGIAISFGTFSTTTTYSVVATAVVTTCVNDMTGSVTVGIDPLPAVFNVTGGGNYCNGGVGVTIGMDNTETGVNYMVYTGSVQVGAVISGTGAAISFGNFTTADVYTAVATNATTGCSSDMAGSATIAIDPLPVTYVVSAGDNYCSGDAGVEVSLSGSETGIEYQLYFESSSMGSVVAGTGSSVSLGMQTGAGVYTVSAHNPATGCDNAMAGTSVIGINGLPAVFSVTGGGSFCAGGTGVAVGLGGSNVGISYMLYSGTTPVGTAVSGSGSPLSFGMQTTGGTYNVVATDMSTSCANVMGGTASVVVTPLSVPSSAIAVFPDDTVCAGTTVVYNASPVNGGLTPGYEWKVNGVTMLTSSTTFGYVPAAGDVVSVILYSSLPCITSPAVTNDLGMTVYTSVMPSATVTATPGDSVCNGTLVSFTVTSENGGDAPEYKWLRNSVLAGTGNTFSYIPADGDGIVVSMGSNALCRLADNVYSNLISMKADESYLPVVTIAAVPGLNIAKGQSVVFTASAASGGPIPTYKWAKNGTIVAGATAATYTAAGLNDKDTVTCFVLGSGLCGRESFNSVVVNVTELGVASVADAGTIRVIPNPTNGEFAVTGTIDAVNGEAISLTVSNVLGQEVYSKTTTAAAGRINARVSLGSNLANGTYLLSVGSAAGRQVFHIVLQH